MKTGNQITERDLLITEEMIAQSFKQMQQSVISVPSKVYHAASQKVQEHPYETAAAAAIFGVVIYGMMHHTSSCTCHQKRQSRECVTKVKETGYLHFIKEMLIMAIPLVTPHVITYIKKCQEKTNQGHRFFIK